MDKFQFLLTSLEERITDFEKESKKHKDMHRYFRYCVFGLTAVSAILGTIAAAFDMGPWINISIVFVSTGIALISAIEGLRKPLDLWIHERSTLHSLRDLKREIQFEAAEAVKEEFVKKGFDRFQRILSEGSQKWSSQIVNVKIDALVPAGAEVPAKKD